MSGLERAIAELLLRNGYAGVEVTSSSVAALIERDRSAGSDPNRIAKAVDRDLAFRSRVKKIDIARQIVAQLPALPQAESERETQIEACVFVATSLEYQAVTTELTTLAEGLSPDGTWVGTGSTPRGHVVAVVMTGQGNVASGAVAATTLSRTRPKFALFAGIAGGLHGQDIGSVVIANNVHDYEASEEGNTRGSRSKSILIPHRVVQIGAALARKGVGGVTQIAVRPIASGEKLITDSSNATSDWIRVAASDAAVVEMEGLGVMRAASNLEIPGTVVRAVSDHGGDKTAAHDAKNQPLAAKAAAKTGIALVDLYLDETEKSRGT